MPRFLFVCALVLALTACEVERSASMRPPGRASAADTVATHDTTTASAQRPDRAAEAGLSPEQASTLNRLGVPILVPVLPEGWRVADIEAGGLDSGSFYAPFYTIRLAHAEGACATLEAASDGLGDVFIMEPPQQRTVDTPGIARHGPALVGWGGANAEEGWADRLTTEWFGADGYAIQLRSEPECAPLSPEAATRLLRGMRYLDDGDDALNLGPMAYVMDVPMHDAGPDPELVALDVFSGEEAEMAAMEGQRTEVETIRRRDRHTVVLVTTTGLLDDSVRDERIRVVLARTEAGWSVFQAGRQVRCHAGRGSQEWTAERCT